MFPESSHLPTGVNIRLSRPDDNYISIQSDLDNELDSPSQMPKDTFDLQSSQGTSLQDRFRNSMRSFMSSGTELPIKSHLDQIPPKKVVTTNYMENEL
jgi:hypothetical protein